MPRKRKLWYVPAQSQPLMLYAVSVAQARSRARDLILAQACEATELQIADWAKAGGTYHFEPELQDDGQEVMPL